MTWLVVGEVFQGMVGNSSHWNPVALGNITGSQHNIQFSRGDFSILVKSLIKIAKAEE
jgi:hypothetical protein